MFIPSRLRSISVRMHSKGMLLSGISMLLPIAVVIFFSYRARNYQVDDALIYLRYVRNFYEGNGLVYNAGDKFNGLTSPLFTYAILLFSGFIKDYQVSLIVASSVFMSVAAVVSGMLFSRTRTESMFTAVTVGSLGYFYLTFGMETPLFIMLIVLALYLYKVKSDSFVIAIALLMSTRSEGVFLAAPMLVAYIYQRKNLPEVKYIFMAAIILISPFVVNYLYYGRFFPETGGAKILQGRSGYWSNMLHPEWAYFFAGGKPLSVWYLLLPSYGAFRLVKTAEAVLACIFLVLLAAFYGLFNIPSYHWYYSPFVLFVALFSCRATFRLKELFLARGWGSDRAFGALCLFVIVAYAYSKIIFLGEGGRHEGYAKIGEWIKSNTAKDASVGMVEIGTVGWYSDRPIIDILGLVNRHNSDLIGKRDVYGWLTYYQPSFILRHDPRWQWEQATEMLEKSGAYFAVSEFAFPGYVLLQKNESFSDGKIVKMVEDTRRVVLR